MNQESAVQAGTPEGAPAPESIPFLASLIGVFASPRRTFERLAGKPRFILPLLLVLVVQAGLGAALFQSGIVRNDSIAKLEAQGRTPEEIERLETFFDSPVAMVMGVVGSVVGFLFVILVSAGLIFFMANLMLGAKLTFAHYLCAVAYSSVVGIVDQLVRSGLAFSRETLDIRLGLGNLFGEDMGYFGRVLDTMTDPLLLWSTAISALAVSVFARKGFGFGIVAVLPGFVIAILLSGMR